MMLKLPLYALSSFLILSFLTDESSVLAFVPSPTSSIRSTTPRQQQQTSLFSSTQETEVEKLLRMARELRQEAEAQEEEIHSTLLTKKEHRDGETDALIDDLFGSQDLHKKLSEKQCCTDTLIRIVDRLFERECMAKGLQHVVPSIHHDHTQFKVEKGGENVDQEEASRMTTMMDQLVEACTKLDDDFTQLKKSRGEKYTTHLEREHWNAGECAFLVNDHIRGLRREHDEQFQQRQQEFYKAQRRKDLPPPEAE